MINGKKVYQIDGVATLIDSIHFNSADSNTSLFAIGSILQSDLTLQPCYIAKVGNHFAHGDTLRQAFKDAESKELEDMPIEQRIKKFQKAYPDADVLIPARELYDWHHVLTGSCTTGRNNFAHEHGIDIDNDSFTIREFITLTKDSYGSSVIHELAKAYVIPI